MGKQDLHRRKRRSANWARKEFAIRRLVREERFAVRSHVFDKIAINYWTLDDVIASILNGHIQAVENDEAGDAIDGKKYTLVGDDCYGHQLSTVGKIVQGDDGQEYLVVTAY